LNPFKKKKVSFNLSTSYSTFDKDYFNIPKIVQKLEEYQEIEEVFYWTEERNMNSYEYIEQALNESKVFVPFCSKNAIKSKIWNDEWMAAFQLRHMGKLKIVPIHEMKKHIPSLLRPLSNVEFNSGDFEKFINELFTHFQ